MDWVAEFFDGPYQDEYLEYAAEAERTLREAEFIAAQLQLGPQSRVLDLACGTGRHCLALAPRVAQVTGLDRTQRFLELARTAQAAVGLTNVEFVPGDMRELDYDAQFDAAINFFTAWGYYSDEENFDVLRRVRRALKPGGGFLLEILNRDALMGCFRPLGLTRGEDGSLRIDERRFDPATGRAHDTRTYIAADDSRKELSFEHYLPTADALLRHFRDAGFSDVRAVEAPSGEALRRDSWRMAVVGVQ